jgi:naphthalene 1,2-dioxygenase system ferredoxin subunit
MTRTWTEVAAETDLFEGAAIAVTPVGHDIALYSIDGEVFATNNVCTHGNASLCEGFLEGHEIECPFHQGRFDVRTGQPTCPPVTEALKTWPVKIEAGRVYLDLGE